MFVHVLNHLDPLNVFGFGKAKICSDSTSQEIFYVQSMQEQQHNKIVDNIKDSCIELVMRWILMETFMVCI